MLIDRAWSQHWPEYMPHACHSHAPHHAVSVRIPSPGLRVACLCPATRSCSRQAGQRASAVMNVGWQAQPKQACTHLFHRWSVSTNVSKMVQGGTPERKLRWHAVATLHVVEPWQCSRQLCLRFTARVSGPRHSHAGRAFLDCCNGAQPPNRRLAVAGREDSLAAAMQEASKVYGSNPSML